MKIWRITSDATANATARDIDGPVAILRKTDGTVTAVAYRPCLEGSPDVEITAAIVPFLPVNHASGGPRRAMLLTGPGAVVHLNGYPPASVAALRDRDVIRVGDARLMLAAFDATRIVRFDASQEGPTDCAACSTPIADGEPVRACPACGVRYHAGRDGDPEPIAPACDEEDDRCSNCRRLRSELVWTPSDLARRDVGPDDINDDDDNEGPLTARVANDA